MPTEEHIISGLFEHREIWHRLIAEEAPGRKITIHLEEFLSGRFEKREVGSFGAVVFAIRCGASLSEIPVHRMWIGDALAEGPPSISKTETKGARV